MAKRGRSARQKGFAFEREIASTLDEIDKDVNFKRGLGQTRGGGEEIADIISDNETLNNKIHIECKRQKRVSIPAAMRQAMADVKACQMPIAITKSDREEIYVTMRLNDWLEMFKLWLSKNK